MHGLLYHITHPSEKKLSISQELAISSIFQQGSNTSQMLFCLSQTALCHCLHCSAISFSCEWREPGLALSAVFVSESSKGACMLSEYRYRHLAESSCCSFYSCFFSVSEKFWADAVDRKLSIGIVWSWKWKKEGKEHWRGPSAQMWAESGKTILRKGVIFEGLLAQFVSCAKNGQLCAVLLELSVKSFEGGKCSPQNYQLKSEALSRGWHPTASWRVWLCVTAQTRENLCFLLPSYSQTLAGTADEV